MRNVPKLRSKRKPTTSKTIPPKHEVAVQPVADKRARNRFRHLFRDLLIASETHHTEKVATGEGMGSEEEWRFSPSEFFARWFRGSGNAYYFLFRKNLKVTNIQFAELLALIRAHNRSKETGESIHDLQFLSVPEFYTALKELVDSFPRNVTDPKARHELISTMYYELLTRHVVVEAFYGSCAVFVPPNIEIDLDLICAHSGYIHSCGTNVFTRKIDKATKEEFFEALDKHIGKRGQPSKPNFFVVYAHEDFTKYEKPEKKEYLKDGLDDVKIYIEKFYMASERLIDVIDEMRNRFAASLLFHPADKTPSDTIRDAVDREVPFDNTRTIWLLVDHSVGDGLRQRGEERFYICYEQHYVNENPFQFFDENKPGWLSHTTLPHTLLAAMINVADLSSNRGTRKVLADPFAGTGTTWIESIKLNRVMAKCTDKAAIAPLLARDNLHFFCASFDVLRHWTEQLEKLTEYLVSPAIPDQFPSASLDVVKDYNWAIEFYDKLIEDEKDYLAALNQPAAVAILDEQSFLRHLFFYLTLRTVGRTSVALKRGSQEWKFAYATQALHLARQIGLLQEARRREQSFAVKNRDHFTFYQSLYSLACTISVNRLTAFAERIKQQPSNRIMAIYDVNDDETRQESSLKPQSCDVIITDPPYGFNTDDDLHDLAALYSGSIRKMIHALKHNGQLVICLLDRSHTGRRSPFFTHKELITQQVLSLAESASPKREVIIPAHAVPEQRNLFRAPYYWESERALRRAILHFKIRIVGNKGDK